jgi:hypothetical protein
MFSSTSPMRHKFLMNSEIHRRFKNGGMTFGRDDAHHNDTQCNDMEQNDNQNNDTRHNDTQHIET